MTNRQNETIRILTSQQLKYMDLIIAEKSIRVGYRYKKARKLCSNYISQVETPDFVISVTDKELAYEFQQSLFLEQYNSNVATRYYYDNVEMMLIHKKMADRFIGFQTLLVHAAAIEMCGKAYIFAAPSGTGKTTHIYNWKKAFPNTIVINGDKPFIDIKTKMVYGSPWCGKEGLNANTAAPLAGIITLERGEINTITSISFKEMLPVLMQQTYVPKERNIALEVYQLIGQLKEIPCYRLRCNMEPESAVVAYKRLI